MKLALLLCAILSLCAAEVSQEEVYKRIFDIMFYGYTGGNGDAPGQPPAGSMDPGPQDTLFTMMNPGLVINAADYGNAYSPENPTGDPLPSESFSDLVDQVPMLDSMFKPGLGSVSEFYELMTTGRAVTERELSEEDKETLQRAKDMVVANGTGFDDMGRSVTIEVDSLFYKNYKRKKEAYMQKRQTYLFQYFQMDMSDPKDQQRWALMGSTYYAPVEAAYKDFQTAQPGRVEWALATLGQYGKSNVNSVFANAAAKLTNFKRQSIRDPLRQYLPSYPTPGNWFASDAADYDQVTIDYKKSTQQVNSHFSKYDGHGSRSTGWWIFKRTQYKNVHEEVKTETSNTATDNLRISFKYKRVMINRPWMDEILFVLGNWKIGSATAGAWSNGRFDDDNVKSVFPLLPHSFVIVKDLEITADFNTGDEKSFNDIKSGEKKTSWGPFSLSGPYRSEEKSKTFQSTYEGKTIRGPSQPQILGFFNKLVPCLPPQA